MLTIELFGFKSSRYRVETEIIRFFEEFDPSLDGQIIFYDTDPTNFQGESTKVIKLIASDKQTMEKLREKGFLGLACFEDVNVGLFHYRIVKKANSANG